MRKIQFQNNEYYHIYNRGVDKRDIFMDDKDFIRFLISMREFNTTESIDSLYCHRVALKPLGGFGKNLVEFISYCLMSNHYHFILKQIVDNGISKFMHKLSMGYAHYFNKKYERSGSLFQGAYKSIHINSSDYLLQLSCYIHGNPEIHKIAKAENYQWSSYLDYLKKRSGTLCNKKEILNDFKDINEYKNLVDLIIKDSSTAKEETKKLFLEEKI